MSERARSDNLPETLVSGGGTNEAERAVADLLRSALAQEQTAPHPAIGARMRGQIEARLADEAHSSLRRRRTFIFGLAAASVAAVALVVTMPRGQTSDEARTVLRGTILALGPDGVEPYSIAVGEEIAADQKLSCASEECEIGVGSDVRAILVHQTIFSITDSSRTEVHAGIVAFTVETLGPGRSFTVHANDTEVRVVGTAFSVERVNASTERVRVAEGTVRVLHGERETYVNAGERWPVAGRRQPVLPQPEPEEADITDERIAEPSTPTVPPTGLRNPAEMIERAEALIKAGDFDAARRIYVELAARTGALGELGLYHLARLDLSQPDATESARASLAQMRRRYPQGALLVERSLTELEVWVRLGECIELRDGVASFRHDFPGSVQMLQPIESAMTAVGCAP